VRQVAEIMANADLGVVPKRADSFGNEAYSTKIMEFMSVGVPVVISSTKIDRFYFDDTVVKFFPSGDHEALAEAILEVAHDDSLRQRLVANAAEYVARNSWESRKRDYLRLVDGLIQGGNPMPPESASQDKPASGEPRTRLARELVSETR
jgi:glycosyltransferase involved in cell wall biosynthesis